MRFASGLLLVIVLLVGCGGGTGSSTSPQSAPTQPSAVSTAPSTTTAPAAVTPSPSAGTTTRVSMSVQFDSASKSLPASSVSLRIWVLDVNSGQSVVAPFSVPRNGQPSQTITVADVPRGTREILLQAVDAGGASLGWAMQAVSLSSEQSSITLDGATTLSTLVITPSAPVLAAGTTLQLQATATFADQTQIAVSGAATWSSDDSSILTLSNTTGSGGLATAGASGATTVRATLGEASARTSASVRPKGLRSITVSPAAPIIALGLTQQFAAQGTFDDGTTQDLTRTVQWSSGSPSIATIADSGLATSLASGTSVITAALGDLSATAQMQVSPHGLVSIRVSPQTVSLHDALESQALQATATFTDGTTADVSSSVTWTVSDGSLLRVDGSGHIGGRAKAGAAKVIASMGTMSGQAAVTLRSAIYTPVTSVLRFDDMQGNGGTSFIQSDETGFLDYPASIAFDRLGRVYVVDENHNRIVRWDDFSGAGFAAFGTLGSGVGQLNSPTAVAIDAQQHIYIVDSGNSRVVRIDDMSGAGWTTFGHFGTDVGGFNSMQGLAIDSRGRIYVSDRGFNAILRFDDMQGTNWTTWGSGILSGPDYIGLDASDRIYVANPGSNDLVRVDDMTGANLVRLGGFSNGAGVAVDSSGRIYVADDVAHRVVRIDDMAGTHWVAFGTFGPGLGQFAYPQNIAIDPQGRIVVCDNLNNRVVRIDDMTGNGLVTLGRVNPLDIQGDSVAFDSRGRVYVSDTYHQRVIRFDDVNGTNLVGVDHVAGVPLRFPEMVAIDARDRIYITDRENHRVIRMDDMDGTNTVTLGGVEGNGVGQFDYPEGLCFDSSGRIYVTNGDNSLVRFDDMDGSGWIRFGSSGAGVNQFNQMIHIAVDAGGHIFIADSQNGRLVCIDDMQGTNWRTFACPNAPSTQPYGMAVDGDGHIYFSAYGATADQSGVYRMDDFNGAGLVFLQGFFPGGVTVR